MAKTYHLYLSRAWFDSEYCERLTALLDERPTFTYNVQALSKGDPAFASDAAEHLAESIRRNMAGSHLVFFLTDVYSPYDKWIDAEMTAARSGFDQPKPIVGVKSRPGAEVLSPVGEAADRIVEWDSHEIVDAIKSLG